MNTPEPPPLGYLGTSPPSGRHFDWLASLEREVSEEYGRLHRLANEDPQYAGHGGEGTWARLLNEWLPPNYEAATRKYILPEKGDDVFETDIVVFRPSYPKPLRAREEVMAGGVAAAFSVKLTLNAEGLRDAYERAFRIKSQLKPRIGTPRTELVGPFPYGLLAHSHTWKASASTPVENVTRTALAAQDTVGISTPRESLDYICVADLGTWCEMRIPYIPPAFAMADLVSPNMRRRATP